MPSWSAARKKTRKDETFTQRLVSEIYSFVSVLENHSFDDIKDTLSLPKSFSNVLENISVKTSYMWDWRYHKYERKPNNNSHALAMPFIGLKTRTWQFNSIKLIMNYAKQSKDSSDNEIQSDNDNISNLWNMIDRQISKIESKVLENNKYLTSVSSVIPWCIGRWYSAQRSM